MPDETADEMADETADTTADETADGGFSWERAAAALDGLPGGNGLNIAHEAVDRHAAGLRSEHVALRFLTRDGGVDDVTYRDLRDRTNRVANALGELGVRPGDRVVTLLGRVPELYDTALGALKARAVYCPLFSAFGPEPVRQRLARGNAKVLVTTEAMYRRKVAPNRADLPDLEHVLLIDGPDEVVDGTTPFHALVDPMPTGYTIGPTSPDDMAMLHFTSGTTGMPKGAVHVHGAVVAHHATARAALDLHADDVFWCTADPGWVTGTSYGIIAPLTHGVTTVVDESEFDARRWYRTLADQRVSVWYTAPTALRMLIRAGDEPLAGVDLSSLRFIASVGEPLTPDAIEWSIRTLGLPVHDNWWQTETGGIMIANVAGTPVRPGSMGRPLPGIDAAVVEVDDDNEPVVDGDGPHLLTGPDATGMLALRRGWPSMFRDYLGDRERYERSFLGDWYLSGDLARRDADGWFHFVGRADDVVKSSGHLVGPFEVESALVEHAGVAEAAVIGLPHPTAGNVLKAFVVPAPGAEPTDALRTELLGFARTRLGPAIAPRSIEFVSELPHTRSGKVLRRLLRARELGLPEGDTSTLEGAPDGGGRS